MSKKIEQGIVEGNKMIAEWMGWIVFEKRYPRNHGIGGGFPMTKDEIIEEIKKLKP